VNSQIFTIFDELLRSPATIARRSQSDDDQRPLVLAALLAIVAGAGIFGGVLATARGGVQLLYSATKLPLALLGTLVLVVPAFHALAGGCGRALTLSGAIALTLVGAARSALVLLALAPVVWLALDLGVGYHDAILIAVACYGLAGVAALRLLFRGLGGDLRSAVAIALFGLVLAPTGAQTAWMLRPFVGRPAQAEVPFFRHRESSFLDSVGTSLRSSRGDYDLERVRDFSAARPGGGDEP
jgi:hypothetical protein